MDWVIQRKREREKNRKKVDRGQEREKERENFRGGVLIFAIGLWN